MRMYAIAIMAAMSVAADAQSTDGCSDLSSVPERAAVQWNEVWTALDEQSSCTQNCHLGSNPQGDLDLSNRNLAIYFLVGQASSQDTNQARVIPGNPLQSLFWQKIGCSEPGLGTPMPPGGSVSLELQALVWDWIAQGAFGESPEDPIPRDFVTLEIPPSDPCASDLRTGRTPNGLRCLLGLDSPFLD